MKKIVITVILILSMVVVMGTGGCSKSNGEGEKQVNFKNMQEDDRKGIRVVNGIATGEGKTFNEQGLYYINFESIVLKDFTYAYTIMYIDYATKQEVYLCNNAGCNHNTNECTAVLNTIDVSWFSSIFLHNGYLYVLSTEPDQEGQMTIDTGNSADEDEWGYEIQTKPAKLYRMKLDGTEREKVYQFEKNIIVESTVLGDENNLYFITKTIKTKNSDGNAYFVATEKNVTRVNTSTWQGENVYSIEGSDNESNVEIIGGYDSSIVLEKIVYDRNLSAKDHIDEVIDGNVHNEHFKNSKMEIVAIDLNEKSQKVVYSAQNCLGTNEAGVSYPDYHQFSLEDSILRVELANEDKIHNIDLRTGKDEISEKPEEKIYDDDVYSDEIVAETSEYYFMTHDCDVEKNEDGWDINMYNYALISKKDYEEGKDNYLPIKMISQGDRCIPLY